MTMPLTPTDARRILELAVLPVVAMEQSLTWRVLAAVPPEHEDYKVAPGVRTVGELVRHIAGAEIRYLRGAMVGEFELPAPEHDPGLAAIVETYRRQAATLRELLAGVSGEDLVRVLDYRGVMRMPALGFIQYAVAHTIHHRGQLSICLRAMGAALPPVYG